MSGRRPKDAVMLEAEEIPSTPVVESTLGGRFRTLRIAAPGDARIKDGRLEWIPGRNERGWWPDGGSASRALRAFIDLATTTDERRYLAFARRYGVLGLNSLGLPACGSMRGLAGDPPQLGDGESWQGWAVSWEPLGAYRIYASGLRAMVALAVALRGGSYVDPARVIREAGLDPHWPTWDEATRVMTHWQVASGLDWDTWWGRQGGACYFNLLEVGTGQIVENFKFSGPLYDGMSIEEKAHAQRRKFGYWATRMWLGKSGWVPVLDWDGPEARLCLSLGPGSHEGHDRGEHWPPNSLFRVLVAHLAGIARGGVHSATCSNCGTLYFDERRIRTDQPGYCDVCKATAGTRRTRKWRERRREAYPNRTPTHTPTAADSGG